MLTRINEEKIKPELVYNKDGLTVYRYKKEHFIYTDNSGDIKSSTINRKSRPYNCTRVFKCDYMYRVYLTDKLIKKINEDFNKSQGYNGVYQQWFKDSGLVISSEAFPSVKKFIDYDCSSLCSLYSDYIKFINPTILKTSEEHANSAVVYDLSKAVEILDLTSEEQAEEKKKNIASLMTTLFSKSFQQICQTYGMGYEKFHGDETSFYINSINENNGIYKMIEKLLQDTIIKELDKLGFSAEIDMNSFNDLRFQRIIKNVKLKGDII